MRRYSYNQTSKYTEAWINADTGEIIIREPYKVIDWTLSERSLTCLIS